MPDPALAEPRVHAALIATTGPELISCAVVPAGLPRKADWTGAQANATCAAPEAAGVPALRRIESSLRYSCTER